MSDGNDLTIDGLGDFRVIGSGGFSTVYAAWEDDFKRWVAVKLLHSLDDSGRRRFERERAIMGQLSGHPSVITPFRSGYSDSGAPYLVMDYVDGGSLETMLANRGTIPAEEALSFIRPVCNALAYGHDLGILHRDIKPGNILLGRTGAKLTDYGISAIREATATQVAFTLAHTPPETFATGRETRDERSDLYSLASTLYTLLSGTPPFETNDENDFQAAYMFRIVEQEAPPIEQYVGTSLHDLIIRGLDKDPRGRPQSANEFGEALAGASVTSGQTTPVPETSLLPPQHDNVAANVTSGSGLRSGPVSGPSSNDNLPTKGAKPPKPPKSAKLTKGPNRAVVWVLAAVVGIIAVAGGAAALALRNGPDDDSSTEGIGTSNAGGGADDTNEATESPEDEDPVESQAQLAALGQPVPGGVLVYGIESDVDDPWAPYEIDLCASACDLVLGAISDPLVELGADGELAPVLAAAIESNDLATVWTVTLRPEIRFHDGTPFDADAVVYNFNVCRAHQERGWDFVAIASIAAVDTNTVVFTLNQPWVGFVSAALNSPCGAHLMSPAWLRTLPSNPLRATSERTGNSLIDVETTETTPDGDPTRPVSSGPFRLASYTPGEGGGVTVERNEDYWRGGAGSKTKEGLPYLDGIEFVISTDKTERSAQLRGGEFDIIHTSNAIELATFQDDEDRFAILDDNRYSDTAFYLINLAKGDLDPKGVNATNPLIDVRVRRALAHGLDRDLVATERGANDLLAVANGPFSPGQPGHLVDNGYPEHNPAAGRQLLAEYISDPDRNDGKPVGSPIAFSFDTTDDPFNVKTNELIVSMWTEAFGSDVDISIMSTAQSIYVKTTEDGNYEVTAWLQHRGFDHDTELRFWLSQNANPVGTFSVNFGRIIDPELDLLLNQTTTETDPGQRRSLFEDINRRFGQEVYYFPTHWVRWAILSGVHVGGVGSLLLPNGEPPNPMHVGVHSTAQLWCSEGSCD